MEQTNNNNGLSICHTGQIRSKSLDVTHRYKVILLLTAIFETNIKIMAWISN